MLVKILMFIYLLLTKKSSQPNVLFLYTRNIENIRIGFILYKVHF